MLLSRLKRRQSQKRLSLCRVKTTRPRITKAKSDLVESGIKLWDGQPWQGFLEMIGRHSALGLDVLVL